jgi:beta-lactam-binding protein with PASTA domain
MASDDVERTSSDVDEAAPTEDTVVVSAGEFTEATEDWPVAEFYRVEPAAPTLNETTGKSANDDTVILTQSSPPTDPPRRLPPVSPGVLVAIAAGVAAVILMAMLLGLHDGDKTASSRPPTSLDTAPVSVNHPPTSASAKTVPLADVNGLSLEEARHVLEADGLGVGVRRVASDRPRDEVLREEPSAGTEVKSKSVVMLIVSRGSPTRAAATGKVRVPGVIGLAGSDAVVALRGAGFVPQIRLVVSTESPGTVIRQSPNENSEAARGSEVVLVVAKGPPVVQRIDVPDVVGTTAAVARQMLRSAGFTVTVVTVPSDDPAGQVLRQSPGAGNKLREGATVALHVSSGPAPVDVPDVVGLDEESARLELENAGFTVRVVVEPTDDGIVVGQAPPGGSTAGGGSLVTLTVSRV